eukprot:scaffold14098_cov66-Cylindrotheca_fusiformis.AAC.1
MTHIYYTNLNSESVIIPSRKSVAPLASTTEHVLAFGFLQQPTRRSSQSRCLTPLFAARSSYNRAGDQGRARKSNHRQRNRGPPNAVNTEDLVQQIGSSRN